MQSREKARKKHGKSIQKARETLALAPVAFLENKNEPSFHS